jgi:NAD/NADP transhydrogenase alpha subunit
MSNNFDLRKFLAENKLTHTAKAINENFPPQPETSVNESEGYVEVMGDEFDAAVEEIAQAWMRWKEGPMTEPEDIEPAKADILDYIKSMLR